MIKSFIKTKLLEDWKEPVFGWTPYAKARKWAKNSKYPDFKNKYDKQSEVLDLINEIDDKIKTLDNKLKVFKMKLIDCDDGHCIDDLKSKIQELDMQKIQLKF